MVNVDHSDEVQRMARMEGCSVRETAGGRGWRGTRCPYCWRRRRRRGIRGCRLGRSLIRSSDQVCVQLAGSPSRLGCESRVERGVGDRWTSRPTESFLAFYGQLRVSWIILASGDVAAKRQLERQHQDTETNLERQARIREPAWTFRTSSTVGPGTADARRH